MITLSNKKILLIIFIINVFCSCKTLKISNYFKLQENNIHKYRSTWVIGNEKVTRKVPIPTRSDNMPPQMPLDNRDTIKSLFNVIYKSQIVDNHKVFYAINPSDTLQNNPSIGQNHFLFSAMIFQGDTTYLAPVYKLKEIAKLKFSDFKYYIPPRIFKYDSIVIKDKTKKTILYDFKIKSLIIDNLIFDNCLTFYYQEDWPDIIYYGEIWVNIKNGILKWVRTTGRTEIRRL
jgi:hypothetical protein